MRMPAAHEYYSKRSRKVSTSQMSLPEQLQNASNTRSAQSMTHLPSTSSTPYADESPDATDPAGSPDYFYRQYHSQHAQSAGPPFRQGALITTDLIYVNPQTQAPLMSVSASAGEERRSASRNGVTSNGQESRPHLASPGLRGRKSSVKNLVAQINASSTENLPPLPANNISRSSSRNVSPIIPFDAQFQQPGPSRQLFQPSTTNYYRNPLNGTATGTEMNHTYNHSDLASTNRRPLFGEVIPGSEQVPLAGFGIHNFRQRSGSEGSPLQSPDIIHIANPVAAPAVETAPETLSDAIYTLSPAVYTAPKSHQLHRRANSESPLTPTRGFTRNQQSTPNQNRIQGGSRIPISIRRGSTSSDVDGRALTPTANPVSASRLPQSERKPPSSNRRRQRSPPQIQSPGQRGKKAAIPPDEKSPSLRANIIVPPPKISPPLRSSRPRIPISSASTAASRAKMAEKITALQKLNNEKQQGARTPTRPPELSDIDLKERRLRITQALSRSLEGPDLKGYPGSQKRRAFSTSRTASPAISDRSFETNFNEGRRGIPAVIVDGVPNGNDSEDHTPIESRLQQQRSFSQNALEAMQGTTRAVSMKGDSPTLGPTGLHYLERPPPLQTDLNRTDRSHEPSSAMTEGTNIDLDPQDDYPNDQESRSILNQIERMRSHDSGRDSSYTFSDRGDQESVHIVLRNTTYLDDEEAIRKGYRTGPAMSDQQPPMPVNDHNPRSSWISSIDESEQSDDTGFAELSGDIAHVPMENHDLHTGTMQRVGRDSAENSNRSTMASDAYTIVNFVLQQHSTSGIVDQQFVDDVYQRILEDSPYEDGNSLGPDRIEQMCLREIQDRESSWYKHESDVESTEHLPIFEDNTATPTKSFRSTNGESQQQVADHRNLAPPPPFKGHRYKSSLDSAEDWLNTSPSVSDWIRFAADGETAHGSEDKTGMAAKSVETDKDLPAEILDQDQKEDEDLYSAPAPRLPQHAPPALPEKHVSLTDESSTAAGMIQRPHIPRRVTSISQMGRSSPHGRNSPSMSAPSLVKTSTEESVTPEQRRLKQRRNVIKELVDTEFSYEKDLRVLCDIYKQTASVALSEDDIRVLFGNVEQIQVFSKDFLMLLKSLAKPTYTMERQDRKKDKQQDKPDSVRPRSSSSTLASNKNSETDMPTVLKDRETRIGQAFEASLVDMEVVYSEYIKNRHAANLRLEAIQKTHSAREWLKECKENSSDITNAWNLDALLVKPVQRITKYPLLLKELVDSTSEDHPDLPHLRKALYEVTEVNFRINDVKKHAELVDQVLNRKRKDSDVRAGLSKAFGRRAEKIKQHVGITELFDDSKYNEIRIHFDNNIVQLMVVGNDCSSYGRAITKWVDKMVNIAAAAEAWVDVGHSNHQEAESKLRQFAMVVRGISTIALPDHIEQLNTRVLSPMQQAVDAMTKFKTDPKGLLQKREKRMIDYVQIRSKKERGEKIDKKMVERMEQSEALNHEAKERMRKLVTATGKLVQACQANLVQMQFSWQSMVRQKLCAAMGMPLENLEVADIVREWQMDFDFQEATALALGICNGSLLAEAVNMVNFQASSTTLHDEDSPRPSFTSNSKRSVSQASEHSYPPIPEYDPRTSGTYGHQYHEHAAPYAIPRARAQSTTSARYARTPELSQQGSATEGFPNYARFDSNSTAPRLSVETHSPLIGQGGWQADAPSRRPASSSTFFSASGTPPPHPPHPPQPHHQSSGSSVFSSAMPMSDSPVVERFAQNSIPEPDILFTAASVYEFNIDRSRREANFPYLTYVEGEIFDVIGERGELWLAKNQDDPQKQIGWIWNKHFAKLAM